MNVVNVQQINKRPVLASKTAIRCYLTLIYLLTDLAIAEYPCLVLC